MSEELKVDTEVLAKVVPELQRQGHVAEQLASELEAIRPALLLAHGDDDNGVKAADSSLNMLDRIVEALREGNETLKSVEEALVTTVDVFERTEERAVEEAQRVNAVVHAADPIGDVPNHVDGPRRH